MKKYLFIIALLACSVAANAQIVETFDSNKFGWQEFSQKDGSALIMDGVLKLKGKNPLEDIWSVKEHSDVQSTCYAPIDPQKNFEIKSTAIAKKINDKGFFGVIFDYKDDGNYSAFYISEGDKNAIVLYQRLYERRIVGRRFTELKLQTKRKAEFDFSIKSTYDDIQFFCNGMKVMEVRHQLPQFTGFGFAVIGQQEVDFDNVEFIQ